jgi:hypothetical protein
MSREFDRVDAALASSVAGRAVIVLDDAIRSAWRSSSTGAAARSIGSALRTMPAAAMIRAIAVAVFIAAALQPLLISAMPATVAPVMPWPAFALIAVFALLAAWRAEAIVNAWPGSTVSRWIGR